MKKILSYAIAAIFAVSSWSCRKAEPDGPVTGPEEEIEEVTDYAALAVGEWNYADPGYGADIRVSFEEEFTFNLYQKVGDGRYRHYSGTWSVEENIISGSYSDGSGWGSSYSLEFVDDDTMIMTALNESDDEMTYFREEIPASIKENVVEVKSTAGHRPVL